MLECAVIPEEVRDPTIGDGLLNQIRVSKTSSKRSFAPLRMTCIML
jgi:hypothetical protein